MKHVIRKLFINFEKEEKWINDMAAKGLNFIDYSISRYLFEEGRPGEYVYRLELLKELPSNPESKAYIKFMEETGVDYVSTYMRWVYFRKKASDGPFDVYSDYESRIKHYERVSALVGVVGGINIFAGILNLSLGSTNIIEHNGTKVNLYCSIISLSLAFLFTKMFISFRKKIRKMKKEKQIYQ